MKYQFKTFYPLDGEVVPRVANYLNKLLAKMISESSIKIVSACKHYTTVFYIHSEEIPE